MNLFTKSIVISSAFFIGMTSIHAEDDETPMTKEMQGVSKAIKSIRKIDPANWSELAAAAKTAQDAFLRSMKYTAALVEGMEDGEAKDIAAADSRRLMGLCYAVLCELEVGYLKKDKELVDIAIKKYKELKSEGHENYTNE